MLLFTKFVFGRLTPLGTGALLDKALFYLLGYNGKPLLPGGETGLTPFPVVTAMLEVTTAGDFLRSVSPPAAPLTPLFVVKWLFCLASTV